MPVLVEGSTVSGTWPKYRSAISCMVPVNGGTTDDRMMPLDTGPVDAALAEELGNENAELIGRAVAIVVYTFRRASRRDVGSGCCCRASAWSPSASSPSWSTTAPASVRERRGRGDLRPHGAHRRARRGRRRARRRGARRDLPVHVVVADARVADRDRAVARRHDRRARYRRPRAPRRGPPPATCRRARAPRPSPRRPPS